MNPSFFTGYAAQLFLASLTLGSFVTSSWAACRPQKYACMTPDLSRNLFPRGLSKWITQKPNQAPTFDLTVNACLDGAALRDQLCTADVVRPFFQNNQDKETLFLDNRTKDIQGARHSLACHWTGPDLLGHTTPRRAGAQIPQITIELQGFWTRKPLNEKDQKRLCDSIIARIETAVTNVKNQAQEENDSLQDPHSHDALRRHMLVKADTRPGVSIPVAVSNEDNAAFKSTIPVFSKVPPLSQIRALNIPPLGLAAPITTKGRAAPKVSLMKAKIR